ncbi:hypothetical protein X747_29760 [Mesorhizobium sp. LNJC384A00]|nr:hypothetical protein X771_32885 [Mesorhizobium sp. LSJC277A00]ESY34130.1 hypothetical protein X747_29760 [Mesorhizobium sp. LNJC384A00]
MKPIRNPRLVIFNEPMTKAEKNIYMALDRDLPDITGIEC